MSNIFLAGRYARRDEIRGYANELAGIHSVTSSWIRETVENPESVKLSDFDDADNSDTAVQNRAELMQSDILIQFTDSPSKAFVRGGRHVEFGIADALNLKLIIVGPRETIYHYMPWVTQYDTWDKCKEDLLDSSRFTERPDVPQSCTE